jgi:hypothetical protein
MKEQLVIDVETFLSNVNDEVIFDFFNGELGPELKWVSDATREAVGQLTEKDIDIKFETYYGGEGMGDAYWAVYSFTRYDEKVYVKFDGYYQSYNGAEYNEHFFVEPKQVTVTKFFRV